MIIGMSADKKYHDDFRIKEEVGSLPKSRSQLDFSIQQWMVHHEKIRWMGPKLVDQE